VDEATIVNVSDDGQILRVRRQDYKAMVGFPTPKS
jgi:hypothetical protein